jgi:hypothetical protein
MSVVREAFIIPLLFLTVALLGGLEPGPHVTFMPPPVFALVLACLTIAALVRAGALAPERLMHGSRTALANTNGAVALMTLFAATAQLVNALTPRSGLPLLLFDAFLLILLTNTLVASPDRIRLLRSMMVIFGSAFVLKFVVLAALSDPEGGRTKRVLVALFDLATLGTVTQEAPHPVSGYLTFITILLYLVGVTILPVRGEREEGRRGELGDGRRADIVRRSAERRLARRDRRSQ